MDIRAGLITLLLVLASPTAALAADPDPARPGVVFLDCGEVVGSEAEEQVSFELGNNLICSSGDALVFDANANGITLDLGGHRLSGDGGAATGEDGIVLPAGISGVTITNGTLVGFDRGFLIEGNNNTVDNVQLIDNNGDSVQITGDGNEVLNSQIVRGGNVLLTDTAAVNTIADNTVVDESIVSNGADDNTIQNNTLLGGGLNFAVGPNGSVSNDFIGNTIIGPPTGGITVSGDTSDANNVDANTIVGAGQRGIDINDGDANVVTENTVTGSSQDGIELRGSATLAVVGDNTSSGNTDDGIAVGVQATGAQIGVNVTNENGDNGIEAQNGAAPDLNDNVADFNGFLNGIVNDSDFGISAPDGTTTNFNEANGNDVVDPTDPQCNPQSLCNAPQDPALDPPLMPCGLILNVPATFLLRHPLDCATGDALKIAASNITLDLGIHRVSGGGAVWSEASVAVTTAIEAVTVRNGVLADSGNGVRLTTATGNRFEDVVATRAGGAGFGMYDTDENVIAGGSSINNSGDGIVIRDGDLNRVANMTLAGNTTGGAALVKTSNDPANLDDRSSKNTLVSNVVLGNDGVGLALANANNNVLEDNEVIGSGVHGIQVAGSVTGSTKNRVALNTVTGNKTAGVIVDADGAAGGAGSPANKIVSNAVNANQKGIVVRDPESKSNAVSKNSALRNDQNGIEIENGAPKTKLIKNVASFNASNGILLDGVTSKRIEGNTANTNGFFADNTASALLGDDVGLGISAPGSVGCANKANDNDDPDQLDPKKLKKKCV